jgi:hypothetical protein
VRVSGEGGRSLLSPLVAVVAGLVLGVALSVGYTTWAIGYHARQSCAELRIIATAGGAQTPYDKAVKKEYQALYGLRCR